MPVQMELTRIFINDFNDIQTICLREVDGERAFSIVIGQFEAKCIERRVQGVSHTRPPTHELLVNVATSLGAEFESVAITELKDHTYFARLRMRQEGELIDVDARPSDAIAVALTCNPPLPIYVAEEVLNEAMEG